MRNLFVVFVALVLLVFATYDNFAQGEGNGKGNRGGKGLNCRYVDANNDGKCDNFVDLNGDGRCDFGGKGYRKGNCYNNNTDARADGKGVRQRNYVDANGDGICDNYQNRVVVSRPYPNPFSSSTNIEVTLPRSGEVQITLNDLMGKVVKNIYQGNLEKGNHKFTIDSQNLVPGRYLIVVKFENRTFSKQVHYNP